ncbi:phage transcriptional regulator AlpA [Burkholderia pseudomallei]|nr:phage transcriptional regulator AlpA [Burkholderia pseudomallei]CAJ8195783.1 phage transcriptional regulator AlpA [Burkholderia pseudomallei]
MRGPVWVKLPPGEAIDVFDFCTAIARALCPTDQLEGGDCIVGGSIRAPSVLGEGRLRIPPAVAKMINATLETSPLSPSDLPDPEFCTKQFPIEAGESNSLPVQLTDDDRHWLEEVLPNLPLLRHPVSDKQAKNFLVAYRALPTRRVWEPVLITTADVKKRTVEQDNLFVLHRDALQRMFESGELVVFDRQRRQVPALTVRSLISRTTAIAYLRRYGLAEFVEHKLSPGERRKAIVAYRAQLEKAGVQAPTKLTAEKFGVSTRYVRDCCEKADSGTPDNKGSHLSKFQKRKQQ